MRPAQESAARIVRAGAACILRAGDLAAPPGAAAAEAARRPTVVWSRTCLLAADGDVKVHLGCNLRALLLLGGVSRVAYRREERQPEHQCRRSAHFVSSVRGVDVAATNFGTNCPSQSSRKGKGRVEEWSDGHNAHWRRQAPRNPGEGEGSGGQKPSRARTSPYPLLTLCTSPQPPPASRKELEAELARCKEELVQVWNPYLSRDAQRDKFGVRAAQSTAHPCAPLPSRHAREREPERASERE